MPRNPYEDFIRNLERRIDSLDPDYPTALINAIDVMRVYLRVDEALGRELLRDEAISQEQFDDAMKEMEPLRAWLKKNEDHGIDPSLHGTIKEQRK